MIVVADAGPLHYLVLIGSVDLLETLYDRAAIPRAVAFELQQTATPVVVRQWITNLPDWCVIHPDPLFDHELDFLGPGERSAIGLAISLHADRLLIDDQAGRAEARRRQLSITGTLGVLAEAHRRNLVDFESAIVRLRQTSFYLDSELLDVVRRQIVSPRGEL